MKTVKLAAAWFSVAETMSYSDLLNSYFGSSNLYSTYANDFSDDGSGFVSDWIERFVNTDKGRSAGEYDLQDFVQSADNLLQHAAAEFVHALERVIDGKGNAAEHILNHCKHKFEPWGNFYLFVAPWSNSCCTYYLIRADNEQEAYEILEEEFEQDFQLEEQDIQEDSEINGNGTAINTENLQLLGVICSD